jgi:hypothetical protein
LRDCFYQFMYHYSEVCCNRNWVHISVVA